MEVNTKSLPWSIAAESWSATDLPFQLCPATGVALYCGDACDAHPFSLLHEVLVQPPLCGVKLSGCEAMGPMREVNTVAAKI